MHFVSRPRLFFLPVSNFVFELPAGVGVATPTGPVISAAGKTLLFLVPNDLGDKKK